MFINVIIIIISIISINDRRRTFDIVSKDLDLKEAKRSHDAKSAISHVR